MLIQNVKIYQEESRFELGDICIDKELIVDHRVSNDTVIDGTGLYAIPGLTDIHFHGCMNFDFCDGTQEAIEMISSYQAKHGITTICPATMTLEEDKLARICEAVATYEYKKGAILCGLNMEGPFLSEKKKGAQNGEWLRRPDVGMFRRLHAKSGNLFKLVSIAPEEDGAFSFISELKDEVLISLAHTTVNYDMALEALKRGASHVTHLYNAMLPFHHREPGLIGAAFDTPTCSVELIGDGIHIHPSIMRATFEMFGENRIILISDSMMATGMPDGQYTLGGQAVKVSGNTATLVSDGTLAGSVTNLMDCMKNIVQNMNIPLETAVKCAAVNPAKAIGIYEHYGSIRPGKIANIVLLDQELMIKAVILKGKIIDLE